MKVYEVLQDFQAQGKQYIKGSFITEADLEKIQTLLNETPDRLVSRTPQSLLLG